MNVLSLFDGISCARIALDRAGIPVENYFASEIDKHAIAISKKNWPDIIHVGDVPIECERLQGLPDNYTFGVANTHRYKTVGNAFNVDIVTHILSYISN